MSNSGPVGEPPETPAGDYVTSVGAARKALALADQLVKIVSGIQTSLISLKRDRSHDRKIIIGLCVSLVLDITLSVVLVVFGLGLNSTQESATQQNLLQCAANNSARTADALLWNTLLNDLDPPGTKVTPQNAADIKEVNALRAVVVKKDALRNCEQIYG